AGGGGGRGGGSLGRAAEVPGLRGVAAVNAAAEADGIRVGDTLADARAKTGSLQVRAADPAADDAALRRLALWATRYTPAVAPWDAASGADGLFLDVAGASHLFGGEEELIADLAARLARFGLPAQLAAATTAGAAWAAARLRPPTTPAAGAGGGGGGAGGGRWGRCVSPPRRGGRCGGSASGASARSSTSRGRRSRRASSASC